MISCSYPRVQVRKALYRLANSVHKKDKAIEYSRERESTPAHVAILFHRYPRVGRMIFMIA